MTTLRAALDNAGFDWATGRIVLHTCEGNDIYGDVVDRTLVDTSKGENHPLLDYRYFDGFGGYEQPLFVAEDSQAMYVGINYDGSSHVGRVRKDLRTYLEPGSCCPVFGGG